MLGGATYILTCTSHTGCEFSKKVVRTTSTNKTVSQSRSTFWWVDWSATWTTFGPQILSDGGV